MATTVKISGSEFYYFQILEIIKDNKSLQMLTTEKIADQMIDKYQKLRKKHENKIPEILRNLEIGDDREFFRTNVPNLLQDLETVKWVERNKGFWQITDNGRKICQKVTKV